MRKAKRILLIIAAILLVAACVVLWRTRLGATHVAFVNYQAIQLGEIARSVDSRMIKVSELSIDKLESAEDYDMVFVNGMGLRLTEEQRQSLELQGLCGLPILTTSATNPANHIVSLAQSDADTLVSYLGGGGRSNYRSMLNYVRRYVDGKSFLTGDISAPSRRKSFLMSHPDLDDPDAEPVGFNSVHDYVAYLRAHGVRTEGLSGVLVTGMMGDPGAIALALEKAGLGAYVVSSMSSFINGGHADSINISAVVNLAHGRMGDKVVKFLEARNVPLFCPLNVNRLDEEWLSDKKGMSGGFMSQSIVTPEIDGALRPMAVFAQRINSDGIREAYAMPERLESFVESVGNYIKLQKKDNKDKRIAIYYYKGPGMSALTASGMEVVPSLFNFLCRLKKEGYSVIGLPDNAARLGEMLQRQGRVLGTYADGAMDSFFKDGNPELVGPKEYSAWVSKSLSPKMYRSVVERYGDFPGRYMATPDGQIAVARLQFGNVVLLPQNMAGEGNDSFKIVHGTDDAPPHPFIASYLWMLHGFKADAVIHFGTHGGLEYTPRKQVALSADDWSDRMIGSTPHVYLYTIGNVGESLIAKRRSYAGIVSHLTPPFMESGVRPLYKELDGLIEAYEKGGSDDPEAGKLASRIHRLSISLGIAETLGIDTVDAMRPLTADEILRVEQFAEEIANEKMTGQLYTLGEKYEADRITSSVRAMTVDPIAYSLLALDKLKGRARPDEEKHAASFTRRYVEPARRLVDRLLDANAPATDEEICRTAGISASELLKAREVRDALRPMDMAEMMSRMGSRMMPSVKTRPDTTRADSAHVRSMPDSMKAHAGLAEGMDPKKALQMAKMMGASPEALKKMAAAMGVSVPSGKEDGVSEMMKMMAEMKKDFSMEERELSRAICEVEQAMRNVSTYRRLLEECPERELSAMLRAMDGGYTSPTPGGDIIANPNTLPTGRNMYGINAEATPSLSAWERGRELAEQTIAMYRRTHNDSLPRKVSYTLWSGEFIETEGATIAQVLAMLGIEPVRDAFGRVTDLRLIPSSELGRPRIDVVVQTSGQLRDLAASRLSLIERAVSMAAAATDDVYDNLVAEGVLESERILAEKGLSPRDARTMSSFRVFGGQNGSYGTGITGMVMAGDRWEKSSEIAEVYLNNMGAYYGSDEDWERDCSTAFEAALSRTDVVIQPRQSNTWGALSLDHVYEFMGGMNLAVRSLTGKEPDAYMSDYRNRNHNKMQELREAIGVESRTTILNPLYIKEKMKGGASSASSFAEVVENAYGWEVMRPEAISDRTWDDIYETYVEDKHALGVRNFFESESPAALQQMTAVMMETIRKGFWQASAEQRAKIAELHTELVNRYGAACTGMVCDNAPLRDFIAANAPTAAKVYREKIDAVRQSAADGMVMKKESIGSEDSRSTMTVSVGVVIVIVVLTAIAMAVVVRRRRKQEE
ncbi:MAG: cobaltochelatase subunit CobN [Bacteroidales bacterium]|nr:cobaltochelatase subunit CobN [Bacteroidales bacterium]